MEKQKISNGMKKLSLKKLDPKIWQAINAEKEKEESCVNLIASENYVSDAVLEAQGSVMTNKYAEGYSGKRYYGGCENMDTVEILAQERAKELFGCEHINVQPHSGTQANIAAYLTVLKPGDTIMGMDLSCGGHLSHGHPLNFSGKYFKVIPYGVNRETEMIDYEEIKKLALEHRPKMIICGASAYSRIIDFTKFKKICDEIGAYLLADIAHIAGLVATGLHPSPVPLADFVTATTHKTLRGPRGGIIMCKKKYAKDLDRAVFPGIQGGPLMHIIAAKAVAFKEALNPEFKKYQKQVVKNAKTLVKLFKDRNFKIVSGDTDNHMFLIDLRSTGLTGKETEQILEKVDIIVNKNTIPFDQQKPFVASGIRIGTPAITTRGMKEGEMEIIENLIETAIAGKEKISKIKKEVKNICKKFPLYRKKL